MKYKIILFIITILTSVSAAAQQNTDDGLYCKFSNMPKLQSSIIHLAQAAPKYFVVTDNAMDNYAKAKELASSMKLDKDNCWKDLAKAYKALSYVACGMILVEAITKAGITKNMDIADRVTTMRIQKDPNTIKSNKNLHLMELKSDSDFVFLCNVLDIKSSYDISGMHKEYENMLDSSYSTLDSDIAFINFQLYNRSFFFDYIPLIIGLYQNTNQANLMAQETMLIGENLDKIPHFTKGISDEGTMNQIFSQTDEIIGYRAKLIELMANGLELVTKRNKLISEI
ncbi:MAG: hypothetical protein LKG25_04125 [Prevotella sp.]|jgi:hypothetical protein|nr:hypothetical protein [Prevotella sp.]MCI1281762.1 hypothetical protein [Prevotella sp.]